MAGSLGESREPSHVFLRSREPYGVLLPAAVPEPAGQDFPLSDAMCGDPQPGVFRGPNHPTSEFKAQAVGHKSSSAPSSKVLQDGGEEGKVVSVYGCTRMI